jgi:TATA element modulatory factor
LETKLEVLRSRTEEASAESTSSSQAKFLRQIETLQTQYSLASENWQGIESTLTSRVAALEKERDDVTKRESDIRRKARDASSKARKLEGELETIAERARALEQDLQEQSATLRKSTNRATQAEIALQEVKEQWERQKKVWEVEKLQLLEEEKAKWRHEIAQQTTTASEAHYLRAESPGMIPSPFRKSSNSDLYNRRGGARMTSELTLPLNDRPTSRRNSTQPLPRTPDIGTPQRQDSTPSLSLLNGHNNMSQTPSIHPIADDEQFETISSPHRTVADMISVGTAGTGPSVQLVERMSAAVRRLESEKAASKEEMARLVAQRDEARNEVVALMREVEEKRNLETKVAQLEGSVKEMDARYETTLEMLGEKSERVEELENDVQDLKQIYKDLVDRTMKG